MTLWAATNWQDLDGLLTVDSGIDLFAMSPHRALNVLWYVRLRHLDDKKRHRAIGELEMPLSNETQDDVDEGAWSAEGQGDAFEHAMKVTTGR